MRPWGELVIAHLARSIEWCSAWRKPHLIMQVRWVFSCSTRLCISCTSLLASDLCLSTCTMHCFPLAGHMLELLGRLACKLAASNVCASLHMVAWIFLAATMQSPQLLAANKVL